MIYLDNAATTAPLQEALQRALPYAEEVYYNPSARYHGGVVAARLIAEARRYLTQTVADAALFDAVFTSCGTEADNQAVFSAGRRGNVVATAGEHAAVWAACNELKNRGTEVRFAPLRADGSVDEAALLSLVDERTALVSVVHVNNETGAINPVAALARRVKEKNPRAVFHSDGVQAYGKIPVRLTRDIDLYSVSAHKIGGLKGTGALFRRKGYTALQPYLFGGGQENGLRSGTENVFGIACFYYAAQSRFARINEDAARAEAYRERLWSLLDPVRFVRLSPCTGTPYILTVSVPGKRGEVLQRRLWDAGVAVGTGSACSSKKPHSRVIEACGYEKEVLDGVLRVSFSPSTTEEEVVAAAARLNEAAAAE